MTLEFKDSPMRKFIAFCNSVKESNFKYEIQDWDNMFGIIINDLGGNSFCLNFYEDGSYRAILYSTKEENDIFKKNNK